MQPTAFQSGDNTNLHKQPDHADAHCPKDEAILKGQILARPKGSKEHADKNRQRVDHDALIESVELGNFTHCVIAPRINSRRNLVLHAVSLRKQSENSQGLTCERGSRRSPIQSAAIFEIFF